ncbi:mRNA triphosphatase CET1 [Hypoxylon trugodes]|uniref:mRNA triphosphatase CET1 n=1 Tax=Hypoxylon trugodes TaxID=326681 RepID=UPI00218D6CBA|nr:mRNA triphosphatase CET1 [Hypoxylon trugodes]KAI1393052.1 mRNA triphosphatase CET1 [Hypoxylon trugodes]
MDLRAMLNGPDGGASKKQQQQQQPPQPSIQPAPPSANSTSSILNSATPTTPSHAGPPAQSFRDYSRSSHASPVTHPHEYPPAPNHPNHTPNSAGPYPSPTSYNPPSNAFAGRPPVPPLQPPGSHDIRSPGSASISGPSPYRRTPTSSVSTASGGYPFPPTQQQQPQQQQQTQPVSPLHRHQYGPPSAGVGPGVGPSAGPGVYSRDNYNSQPHNSISYAHSQQSQPLPQTPPVGTPGGSHQYLHQRSHSIQSTPTPTSAHSQQPLYGAPYVQGSPIATTHPHPHPLEQQPPPAPQQHQVQQLHQRQSSQPPTPIGPPLSGPPRQSPAVSYQQPPSPYQKRISTASTVYPPHPSQTSPKPLPPASIQRMSSSSSHGTYDAVAESHRGSQAQSDRERSVSVSPKTRVPSLPSNGGHRPPSTSSDVNPYPPQRVPQASVNNNIMESQHPGTPAKRKLEQRDLGPDELESDRKAPPPPQMNGNHAIPLAAMAQATGSPTTPRRKRVKYAQTPSWARSGKDRDQPRIKSRNFSLKQHNRQHASAGGQANGSNQYDAGGSVKSEHMSRHASPEATRSAVGVKTEETNNIGIREHSVFNGQPFPWEPSIGNETPKNIVSREVADFLGIHVLQFPQFEEVHSRGAQFEIEAKLGVIIDKNTNDRIYFPEIRAGECVLNGGRVAFRSSMTESQHCELNGYLNEQVKASFPRNPTASSRVQVHYVHRREVDRFFELTPQMRQRIPGCISSLLQPSSPVKARVTCDQKTGNVLAKIVKARIADLNIHFPHLPLDCRISINVEWDWDGTAEEIERFQNPNKERAPDRIKDRLSYKHGFYQIDLTQVTQGHPTSGVQPPQPHHGTAKEHELEVELEARPLIDHGRMLMRQEPNRYEDLVDGLVNNVRLLARRCPPTH